MTKRILVVDDSSLMRRIIRKELEEGGDYEIFEAENGEVALSKISQFKPDLITLDVDMPLLNGFDTCYKLRTTAFDEADYSSLPVIFVTASDNLNERAKGFELGAADFINKPFVKGEVIKAVQQALFPAETFKVTAVVADDSKTARKLIVQILRGEGLNVLEATDGKEAYELIRDNRHEVDLVITDSEMPIMSGGELCRKVRESLGLKQLPIIFLSGMTERNGILEMFKAGATDYIVKPFAKEELMARLKVHLQARILNRALEENVLQLKQLNKLKDDFLAVTSHDLRSPLNGVLGFSDLLLSTKLDEDQRTFVEHIQTSGNFLLSLINELLDLGKITAMDDNMEMMPMNLVDLMEEAITTIRHMATPKGINLIVETQGAEALEVLGNHHALIRIFNNLLSNAIKFTPTQGRVTVRIRAEGSDQVSVMVQDTGIGIPKDKIPVLFDKYTSASRAGTAGEKSTGLGMSITRDLIDRHEGRIEVESVVGLGTTMTLWIPLLGKAAKDAAPAMVEPMVNEPAKAEAKPAQGVFCLLVDDNELNRKLASLVLQQRGCEVLMANNGADAANLFEAQIETGRPFQLVFMDIHMPVLNGYESTKMMRLVEENKQLKPTPIIAMTAGVSQMEQDRCHAAGMNEVMEKPVNLIKLQQVIEYYVQT